MKDFLAKNIAYLRRCAGLTQLEMAEALKINRTRLSSYEQGTARPPVEILLEYSDRFGVEVKPLVRLDLTSHTPSGGGMLKTPEPAPSEANLKVLAITVGEDDNENIEFIPIKAAAGYAASYFDHEYIRSLDRFRLPFLGKGTYRAFEIHGDSMLPIITGSVIIGQYLESWKQMKLEETYILVTLNNGILFKRLAAINSERMVLKSDNNFYSSYTMPLAEISEIWKAKLYMSTDFNKPDAEPVLTRIEKSLENLRSDVSKMQVVEGGLSR